jgi:hypothetical protein
MTMASVKLGGGVTDIRGSIGGTTFSRGPAGAYARQRVKPVNPCTQLQVARRARVSYLAAAWTNVLDQADRNTWIARAQAMTFLNKVGDAVNITGLSLFLRLNALQGTWGNPVVHIAQTANGYASSTIAVVSASKATSELIICDPSAGFDKSVVGEYLLVFAGLPMGPGRTASPRGFRYVTVIKGAVSPPTFPFNVGWPYPAQIGDNYPISLTHVDVYNRVSTPVDYLAVVVA